MITLICYSVAIGLNIWSYVIFTGGECGNDTIYVSIVNSFLIVLLVLVQLLHFNPQGSLLTTGLTTVYISYLCFICQFSYPGCKCFSNIGSDRIDIGSLVGDIIVSLFFFILTMYGSVMGGTGNVKVAGDVEINQTMGVGQNDT